MISFIPKREEKTGGFKCLTICQDCLATGLLPFKHGRKSTQVAAKEKQAKQKSAQEKRKPKSSK